MVHTKYTRTETYWLLPPETYIYIYIFFSMKTKLCRIEIKSKEIPTRGLAKVFWGLRSRPFVPQASNPTFSPRIARVARFKTRFDLFLFILIRRLVQGEVSATRQKYT